MRQPDFPLRFYTGAGLQVTAAAAGGALIVALASLALHGATGNAAEADAARQSSAAPSADTVELKVSQLGAIRVGPIGDHEFVYRKQAVGIIDFNQDLNVQVFTPYQGRIIQTYADLGDPVKKGQVLFTIESADFLAAESNLIGAAATLDVRGTRHRSERLRDRGGQPADGRRCAQGGTQRGRDLRQDTK
jgi:cobalt-zinc-cadmium efflux system membrane fusion protein